MNAKELKNVGLGTRCVHSGLEPDEGTGAVKRPLIMANSYAVPVQTQGDVWDGVPFAYARDGHPNARWLEERLLTIEGGEDCVVTASGVSAIVGTFYTLLSAGDHVVATETSYVSVREILINHFPSRFGIKTSMVDTSNLAAVREAITPKTKLIHIETPANPTTSISDIAEIAKISRECGALLMVDSTWSGMLTQHPLELGADLVVHSLSKYINGHGDALGGAVIGRKELIDQIRFFAVKTLGGCISPFNAWQIMRSIVTLPMRMEKHSLNAMKVAEYLDSHPKVAWVWYPGLDSHPQHDIAKKQMNTFSGMLTFDIKGDPIQRAAVIERLKFFTHATCLGHDESLIMIYNSDGQDFFRVSIGLEDAPDLIADLEQALSVVIV